MKIFNLAVVFFLLFSFAAPIKEIQQKQKRDKPGKPAVAKIVFKSSDGGQSWQDISEGLPENLLDGIQGNSFFANDKGLFLKVGNGLYQSTPNAKAPFWTQNIFPGVHGNIAPVNSGIFYWGVNLKKTNGTDVWSPIFNNDREQRIRSVFEAVGGAIFISTDGGLYKTTNNGKTWKLVHNKGMDGNMAELNGVLVATSMRRIIRSTDNGESWQEVTNKGAVTFDVKQIKGGFAAITAGSESGNRSLRTSYDGGKTWQPIDAGLQDKVLRTWNDRPNMQRFMTSITQVGENLFCTHADGIFKSSDKGKTWKLLLPSIEDKVFYLLVSGNVIYAIPGKGGC